MLPENGIEIEIGGNNTEVNLEQEETEVAVNHQNIEIEINDDNDTEVNISEPQSTTLSLREVIPAGYESDHSHLSNLDYASSGHTGFASETAVTTLSLRVTSVETTVAGKYTKPNTGIPFADLASTVQASLNKADTAVQPAQLPTWVSRGTDVTNGGLYIQIINDTPTVTTLSLR